MTEESVPGKEVWNRYFGSYFYAKYFDELLSRNKQRVQHSNIILLVMSFFLALLSLPPALGGVIHGGVSVASFVLSCAIFVFVLYMQVLDLPSRLSTSIQAVREWSSIRDAIERVWIGLERGDKVDRKDWQPIQDKWDMIRNVVTESKLTVVQHLSEQAEGEAREYFEDLRRRHLKAGD